MPQYFGHIDYIWKVIFYELIGSNLIKIIEYDNVVRIPHIHDSVVILDNKYRVVDICYDYDNGIITIKTLKTNE